MPPCPPEFCGTQVTNDRVREFCNNPGSTIEPAAHPGNGSLMLVTPLSPVIGYDKASAIAHKADDECTALHGTALHEAASASGYIDATDFDRIVDPAAMVGR
jgi:fumarate hydratase class II